MRTRLLAAALIAVLLTGMTPAIAHQPAACPATATCYEGHELEFDASDGPIQFLVVATTVRTVTTLDGQTTTETATLVEFASNGDQFVLVKEFTFSKTGNLADADVGDTFQLTEVSP